MLKELSRACPDILDAEQRHIISDDYRIVYVQKQSLKSVENNLHLLHCSCEVLVQIIKEQGKVISKRKFRNLPKVKKFKLLNSTRLQVLHKRQGTLTPRSPIARHGCNWVLQVIRLGWRRTFGTRSE